LVVVYAVTYDGVERTYHACKTPGIQPSSVSTMLVLIVPPSTPGLARMETGGRKIAMIYAILETPCMLALV
jgi:hypothetical protein